jgi:hypothetical protein
MYLYVNHLLLRELLQIGVAIESGYLSVAAFNTVSERSPVHYDHRYAGNCYRWRVGGCHRHRTHSDCAEVWRFQEGQVGGSPDGGARIRVCGAPGIL